MSSSPLVSIIILSYNNSTFIDKCLSCAIGQNYQAIEIIVVDQCSTDGTSELIRRQFPQIKLIQHVHNTGFPDGMNHGIRESVGQYVLLLNSDLFLDPAFIGRMVEQFHSSTDTRKGMIASIVYKYKDDEYTKEIDSVGLFLLPYNAVVNSENIHKQEWVFGPSGSAMFLKRSMLEDIKLPAGNYLDSAYFCYGEDIELYMRAQLFGWRCLYVPIVAGWHIGAASVGMQHQYSQKPLPLRTHALKNRYLTLLACHPFRLLIWTLPWNLLADCGMVIAHTITGRLDHLKCLFSAFLKVFAMLPAIYAKRRWIQKRNSVSYTYLRSLYIKWGFIKTLRSLVQKI